MFIYNCFKTSKLLVNRDMLILPCFLTKFIYVHNGKSLKRFLVGQNMLYKTAGSLFFSKKKTII